MRGFVLVGGWPASGKTTLGRDLADALEFDFLSKDEVKEALMDELGASATVEESRRLGRAAVAAVLRAARGCRAAVIDSTWFPYTAPMVDALPGPFVEIRCEVPVSVARARYRQRVRDLRHLDAQRTEAELWGEPVAPLAVGPLVSVDTSVPVDMPGLAEQVRGHLTRG
ncbi:AAA family ATPase [Propioniciclava soli]|uniref:AAA family ATPase n=1 Tax=Propioniciclava soli TaxID=2775081 RepID=UPI001E33B051|nr:AAA family ATPase [Propioniciclava soli]